MQYILAHDMGTSENKAVLYDEKGSLAASCTADYETSYPGYNKVEQNSETWWKIVCSTTKEVLRRCGAQPKDIAAVSFSAHMMGCLLVDRNGVPLHPSLIWADMRAQEQEAEMLRRIGAEEGYRITGNRLSASYSGAKLMWMRDNHPDLYRRAYKMLQAKDYIALRMTGSYATDYSDASGTNLFDIHHKCWSEDIVRELGLDPALLPDVHASTDIVGKVTPAAAVETGLLEGTPVVIGGADGSCAAVGAGAIAPGITYSALGTSAWISTVTESPVLDPAMRTFNFIHLDPRLYTPIGTMQAAGASLKWLRKAMWSELSDDVYRHMDQAAACVPVGSDGLFYLPYLLGERSPHWNPEARGAFIGLDISHTRAHMCRAVEEGVGFNLRIILDALCGGSPLNSLILIGGAACSQVWASILADIFGCTIQLPRHLAEATSIGAAICGGVGIGMFPDFQIVRSFNAVNAQVAYHTANHALYEKLYAPFQESYQALRPIFRTQADLRAETHKSTGGSATPEPEVS